MRRNIIIHITLLAALALALPGCGAHRAPDPGDGLSLMQRYRNGQPLFDAKDAKDAKSAQAVTPDELSALADASLAQGRLELAFHQYGLALKADPQNIAARYGRGLALLQAAKPREALSDFQAVLETEPGHAGANEHAGLVYLDAGLPGEAAEHFRAALQSEPGRLRSLMALGAAQGHMGRQDEAAETYAEAVLLAPGDAAARHNLGASLLMLGRPAEAAEALMQAVRLGGREARTYNNLGLALYKLGRQNEALQAFAAAGGEAAANNNLGWFLFQDGRYQEAAACFERAIELEPSFYVRAHENLKRARLAAGFRPSQPLRSPEAAPAMIPAAALMSHSVGLPDTAPTPALFQGPAVRQGLFQAPAAPQTAPQGEILRTAQTPVMRDAAPYRAPEPTMGRRYTVHVSSWRTAGAARQDAARLRNRLGLETFVFSVDLDGSGLWYRVTTGIFYTLEDARKELDRLRDLGFKGIRVIRRSPSASDSGADPAGRQAQRNENGSR